MAYVIVEDTRESMNFMAHTWFDHMRDGCHLSEMEAAYQIIRLSAEVQAELERVQGVRCIAHSSNWSDNQCVYSSLVSVRQVSAAEYAAYQAKRNELVAAVDEELAIAA